MKIELRPFEAIRPEEVYELFQQIPREENGLNNNANGLSESEFASWFAKQINNAKGADLPEGWVPCNQFVLFVDGVPVGRSKLHHWLNPALERHGGHIGYGIAQQFRGKGFGNIILAETLKQAKVLGLPKVLITVNDTNLPSWKVIEHNGGIMTEKISQPDGTLSRLYWISL